MKKDERKQLDSLSKILYGSSSRWHKMVNKGEIAPLKETLEDGTERQYKGISYMTETQVQNLMEELWKEEQETQAKKEVEESVINKTEQSG